MSSLRELLARVLGGFSCLDDVQHLKLIYTNHCDRTYADARGFVDADVEVKSSRKSSSLHSTKSLSYSFESTWPAAQQGHRAKSAVNSVLRTTTKSLEIKRNPSREATKKAHHASPLRCQKGICPLFLGLIPNQSSFSFLSSRASFCLPNSSTCSYHAASSECLSASSDWLPSYR